MMDDEFLLNFLPFEVGKMYFALKKDQIIKKHLMNTGYQLD